MMNEARCLVSRAPVTCTRGPAHGGALSRGGGGSPRARPSSWASPCAPSRSIGAAARPIRTHGSVPAQTARTPLVNVPHAQLTARLTPRQLASSSSAPACILTYVRSHSMWLCVLPTTSSALALGSNLGCEVRHLELLKSCGSGIRWVQPSLTCASNVMVSNHL